MAFYCFFVSLIIFNLNNIIINTALSCASDLYENTVLNQCILCPSGCLECCD